MKNLFLFVLLLMIGSIAHSAVMGDGCQEPVVRLTHLSNVNTSMDYPVGAGETGLLIATNDWQAGVYVVSLFENNKLVDSKQIIINP